MGMAKTKYIPDPRGWTQEQVAARIGVSVQWLYDNKAALIRAGMPQPDALLAGKTDSVAFEVWWSRRSGLVDWNLDKSDDDPFVGRLAS